MAGSYLTEGGVLHAKTMLAWHRDGESTARTVVIFFSLVLAVEGWLWIDTSHPAFAFAAGLSVLLILLGVWLHIRHGKRIAYWEDKLEEWERLRRDRLIHARHLKGFEL